MSRLCGIEPWHRDPEGDACTYGADHQGLHSWDRRLVPTWTEDLVIEAMLRFRQGRGRLPSYGDWRTPEALEAGYPSAQTVRRIFGTWSRGKAAARGRLSRG